MYFLSGPTAARVAITPVTPKCRASGRTTSSGDDETM